MQNKHNYPNNNYENNLVSQSQGNPNYNNNLSFNQPYKPSSAYDFNYQGKIYADINLKLFLDESSQPNLYDNLHTMNQNNSGQIEYDNDNMNQNEQLNLMKKYYDYFQGINK